MQVTFKSIAAVALAAIAITLTGCKDLAPDAREKGEEEQNQTIESARASVPTPSMDHFLVRKAVREYMERQDVPQKTFFTYIFADTGNVIGYYVGQSKPISSCTLMTPPDQLYTSGSSGRVAGTIAAPTLDGVYSGGSCDTYFFFDAQTDALIEIRDFKYITADQPLSIKASPIKVEKR